MNKLLLLGSVCLAFPAGILANTLPAPQPMPIRVAIADKVLVGKVARIDPKPVAANMFKGDTRQLKIATVAVEDTLTGKAVKEVKVGFFPPPPPPPPPKDKGPVAVFVRHFAPQLAEKQEACFFLTRHPSLKDTYVVQAYTDVLNKAGNATFANTITDMKVFAGMLARPMRYLEGKNPRDRVTTAVMLIAKYRTPRVGSTKTALVSAKESKLLLQILADDDWARWKGLHVVTPQDAFYRLGLTAKDGWTQPRDYQQYPDAAKKWLKANAGKYRITRFVAPDEGPAVEPEEK
jgi:hypothetical protein